MSEATTFSTSLDERRDWRLRISLGITVVWLVLGFLYISNVVGWTGFVSQKAPALGNFLEGAFAPLAFLWLVVGFFLQQRQLEQNTATLSAQLEVMRESASQAEIQSRAIAADELHSRQDTFLRVAEMVRDQLGVIAGFLYISWAMDAGLQEMEGPDGALAQFKAQGSGDRSAFDRAIFRQIYAGKVTAAALFWGTPVRSQHSQNYIRNFERLARLASDCDPEGVISDALRDGTSGRVCRFMQESRPA
jgi:hypothetical protein